MISTSVNYIHHLTYLPSVCVRTFKDIICYSLSNFNYTVQVLSTTDTVLYIRPSDLIHLIAEILYLFTNLFLFLTPPVPGDHFFILYFYEFDIFFLCRFHI